MARSSSTSFIVLTLFLPTAGCSAGRNDAPEECRSEACLAGGGMLPDDGSEDGDDPEPDSDGDESGSTGDAAGGGLPCDVVDVLARHCGDCHGEPPKFGAPMSLVSYEDLHVPAITNPGRPVSELVVERIDDEKAPMPPTGRMPDEDRKVLLDWIEGGARLDPTADCELPDDDGGDTEDELPCKPDVVMTAHASGSDEPFEVPKVRDLYMCFAFQAPFTEPTQATAWTPIIDDARVVHHWILYRTKTPQPVDGAFACDVSLQLTADFVAGWAPGGGNMIMPDDVGLDLGGPGDWYVLQVHYNNTANYSDALDESGVGFCTADEPRPNLAGIVTLGSLDINIPAGAEDHQVTGTCSGVTNLLWPEMHLLGASPHMHQLGRSMRSIVNHLDGTQETLVDVPAFDFESQGMYFPDEEILLRPGDSITTTCAYDNPNPWPVVFGEGTNDEMCFDFVLAYPVNTLLGRNCLL